MTLGACGFKFRSHLQNGAFLQSGKLLPARQAITRHTGVPEKEAQRRYAVNFEILLFSRRSVDAHLAYTCLGTSL